MILLHRGAQHHEAVGINEEIHHSRPYTVWSGVLWKLYTEDIYFTFSSSTAAGIGVKSRCDGN
jgi:hypothetical protein